MTASLSSKELAGILYRRYEILEALYPDREYTMTELSNKTGIDLGNLSKQINGSKNVVGLLELELPSGEALIDVREEERERGRPLKYVKLTEAGRKIISPIIEASRPKKEKPRKNVKFGKRYVDELLSVLDPLKSKHVNSRAVKSEKFRRRVAKLFRDYCAVPRYGLCEHEEVLRTFKRMVDEPEEFTAGVDREVADSFYSALDYALRWMLERGDPYSKVKETWKKIDGVDDFIDYVYYRIRDHLKGKSLDENLRLKFLGLLKTIYTHEQIDRQEEIINLALDLCSDEDVKIESPIYERIRELINRVLDSPNEDFKWKVYERLCERANSEKEEERKKYEPIVIEFFEGLMETLYGRPGEAAIQI
ncbi:MAG: hypothetical protein JRC66_06830 [Deltaproteobacteria bacterium]|nr:hypothetical protein [Deltaproteobacteria bacterium]